MQLVKIVNPSKPGDLNYRTLHMVHQEEVIDIEPGQSRIVPFDVAAAFFGHPKERDHGANRGRTDNYARIKFMWGYQSGALNADEDWAVKCPPFRVETLDGDYMPMILDDPEGVKPLPGDAQPTVLPVDPSVALLQSTIQQQQAEIDKMQAMIQQHLSVLQPVAPVAAEEANTVVLPSAPVDEQLTADVPVAVPTSRVVRRK